ncbi:DUF1508 domain-containing protein [Streptomyces altiplanensis]
MAARFEVRHRPGKGCHFALILTSEYYETHRVRPNGIDSAKRNADAPVHDVTPRRRQRKPTPGARPPAVMPGHVYGVSRLSMERQVGR